MRFHKPSVTTIDWQTITAKKKKKINHTEKYYFKYFIFGHIKIHCRNFIKCFTFDKIGHTQYKCRKNRDKTFQHKLTNKYPENKQPAKMKNNMFSA
jgi:hypothetical protein